MIKCPKCAYENKEEDLYCLLCSEALQKSETDELHLVKASHSINKVFSEKFWETIVHSKLFF